MLTNDFESVKIYVYIMVFTSANPHNIDYVDFWFSGKTDLYLIRIDMAQFIFATFIQITF